MNRYQARFILMFLFLRLMLGSEVYRAEEWAVVHKFSSRYTPGGPLPRWSNGFLAYYDFATSPNITVTDKRGNTVTKMRLTLADVPYLRITDISVSETGRIAMAGIGRNNDREAHFIVWASRAGTVELAVRTDPFMPEAVIFVPDGTLWAVGGLNTRETHDMMRHYDTKGAVIASALSSRDFLRENGLHPAAGVRTTASPDRIGILTKYANAWVEVSPTDGKVLGRWSLPAMDGDPFPCGCAITQKGDAYIALQNSPSTCTVFRLDRMAEKWVPVPTPEFILKAAKTWITILGSDENDVIITNDFTNYFVMGEEKSRR